MLAKNLHTLWAREKVASLRETEVLFELKEDVLKQEITEIGLNYQILTPYTSFVAVEDFISNQNSAHTKDAQVANLVPAGQSQWVPIPNTATPAFLKIMIGLALVLIAGFLYRRQQSHAQRIYASDINGI